MSPPSSSSGGDGGARPPYSQYVIDIYTQAIFAGKKTVVTSDPNQLEHDARKAINPNGFGYIFGGAGEHSTGQANRLAFRQWKLIPRFLRPTVPRDLRIELFGKTYDCPVLMAPVGVMSAYHADAESGVAAACASLGVPFISSTASSQNLEEVAACADRAFADSGVNSATGCAPRWFQLYWPVDDEITVSLLARAKAVGCDALVVTLDTFSIGFRPVDLNAGYLPFVHGEGCALGFNDPVVRRKFAAAHDGASMDDPDSKVLAARYWMSEVFSGYAHRWEDLATLRRLWGSDRPILLKGVQSVEDALLAVRCGMDGIIVSNHGGRQLDGAVASLEMLPEIVDAVGHCITVLFDSGIRTGADAMKALALGAKAVCVGRPVVYGLGIAGTEGAKHVLAALLAELDQSMGLAGIQKVSELNRSILRRTNYGGDVKSCL